MSHAGQRVNAMTNKPRKFFKPHTDINRDRLDFSSIVEYCPDLGNRVIVVRSRTRDLRQKFQLDCNWALNKFNLITSLTILIAVLGAAAGIVISVFYPTSAMAAIASIAIGALMGIAGAATKAFGWHKRYHAMFCARWAMASLEIQIDNLLSNLAQSIEEGAILSDDDRSILKNAAERWVSQIDATLKTFGDSYGAAITPVEIKTET